MSNETTEIIINSVSPHLTILSDTSTRDRPVKRRAIEAVKKETLQIKTWTNASTAAADLLAHLVDSLLKCTTSLIENVREQTVGILESLIEKCELGGIEKSVIDKLLKMCCQQIKQELTEEIRVAWLELCVTLLKRLTDISVTEGEWIMNILKIAGEDPFSEVLQRAAKLIIFYAQLQSKSTKYACERMIRLTIPLLVHKHTAVRVLGIKAMESVLLASAKGLHLLFEYNEILDRQPIVPALIYDVSALVRDNLFIVLGKLLCNWSPRDRYQYGEKLLPIILSGTFDDLPSIQITCNTSLNQVGHSCAQDLFEADIIKELPTDDKELETIGLKHLVHMCFDKSILQLLVGSTDFITARQATSLDSLRLFLQYAQVDDLVKHINTLIHHLMVVSLNNKELIIKTKVFDIIALLASKLPSSDIYLDVLLSELDDKYLAAETNGFPGFITVMIVMTFLNRFISVTVAKDITTTSFKRVLVTIGKPYLKEYIVNQKDTIDQIEIIKSMLSPLIK